MKIYQPQIQFSGIYAQRPPRPVKSFQGTLHLQGGERTTVWGVDDADGPGFQEVSGYMNHRDIFEPWERAQQLREQIQPLSRLHALVNQEFEKALRGTDNSR